MNIPKEISFNKFNYESNINTIYIDEVKNNSLNYIKFKIIRLVLSSNYDHCNNIGLTGLEFFDTNNKLLNIETANTIDAFPKDLHIIYNNENDTRILKNIFNGENNTNDSYNMWSTLFNPNKSIKDLPYIELSFNETIFLSKIRFHNFNKINQLDKCLKNVDIFLDNKFYKRIYLKQGIGYTIIKNDFSQDICFPLNNDYFNENNKNRNKYENVVYDKEKGINIENIDYASTKFEQGY